MSPFKDSLQHIKVWLYERITHPMFTQPLGLYLRSSTLSGSTAGYSDILRHVKSVFSQPTESSESSEVSNHTNSRSEYPNYLSYLWKLTMSRSSSCAPSIAWKSSLFSPGDPRDRDHRTMLVRFSNWTRAASLGGCPGFLFHTGEHSSVSSAKQPWLVADICRPKMSKRLRRANTPHHPDREDGLKMGWNILRLGKDCPLMCFVLLYSVLLCLHVFWVLIKLVSSI